MNKQEGSKLSMDITIMRLFTERIYTIDQYFYTLFEKFTTQLVWQLISYYLVSKGQISRLVLQRSTTNRAKLDHVRNTPTTLHNYISKFRSNNFVATTSTTYPVHLEFVICSFWLKKTPRVICNYIWDCRDSSDRTYTQSTRSTLAEHSISLLPFSFIIQSPSKDHSLLQIICI